MPRSIPWLKPSGSGSSTKGDKGRANVSSGSCTPAVLAPAPLTCVAVLWRAIGRALDAFTPAECAHYLAHAGHVPSNRETL